MVVRGLGEGVDLHREREEESRVGGEDRNEKWQTSGPRRRGRVEDRGLKVTGGNRRPYGKSGGRWGDKVVVRGLGEKGMEEVQQVLTAAAGRDVEVKEKWWGVGGKVMVVQVGGEVDRGQVLEGKSRLRHTRWAHVFLEVGRSWEDRQREWEDLQEELRRARNWVGRGEMVKVVRGRVVIVQMEPGRRVGEGGGDMNGQRRALPVGRN